MEGVLSGFPARWIGGVQFGCDVSLPKGIGPYALVGGPIQRRDGQLLVGWRDWRRGRGPAN